MSRCTIRLHTCAMRGWLRYLPHPALIFVVLVWGANFNIIKVAIAGVGPEAVALVRYLLMAVVLFATCVALRIPLKYPRGQVGRFFFAGFLANGLYMVFFVEGMKSAGAAQGAIVLATAPIWIALFAILKKQEVFTSRLAIGGFLSFSGAVLTIIAGGGEVDGSAVGAILVLVSAVVWAWSVVLMRELVTEGSPYAVFTLSFPGAIVVMLPYGIKASLEVDWAGVSTDVWLSMAYLVFFAGVGGFAAYYKALADVGPTKTSMTQYFISPTAALFAWLVFGGEFVPLQLVGLAIVVFGTYIANARLIKEPVSTV